MKFHPFASDCVLVSDCGSAYEFRLRPEAAPSYCGVYSVITPASCSAVRIRAAWKGFGTSQHGRLLEAYVEADIEGVVDYRYDLSEIPASASDGFFDVTLRVPREATRVICGVRSNMVGFEVLHLALTIEELPRVPNAMLAPPGELWSLYRQLLDASGCYPERFQSALHDIVECVYSEVLKIPGDVLDLGANIGRHTLKLQQLLIGSAHRVVAVEPNPLLWCKLTAALGGAEEGPNHRFLQAAVVGDSQATTAAFFIHPGQFSREDTKEVVLKAFTIDQIVKELDLDLAFVKIDVESFEYEILRGQRTLFEQRPILAFEFNTVTYTDGGVGFYQLLRYHDYLPFDAFLNQLTETTWRYPISAPIDRLAFPLETPSGIISRARDKIAAYMSEKFGLSVNLAR
jgi:FkbM family methyltransferase